MAAGEIATHFAVTRPAISQHLSVLLAAGLVSERRVGTKRLFRTRPEGLEELRAFLAEMWPLALGSFKAAAEAGESVGPLSIGRPEARSRRWNGRGRDRTMTLDPRTALTFEQMKAASRRLYVEVFGAGSLDAADEIMAVSCISHGPGIPPVVGTDPIKQQAKLLRGAVPDLKRRARRPARRGRSCRQPLERIRHEHRCTANSGRVGPADRPASGFHRDLGSIVLSTAVSSNRGSCLIA